VVPICAVADLDRIDSISSHIDGLRLQFMVSGRSFGILFEQEQQQMFDCECRMLGKRWDEFSGDMYKSGDHEQKRQRTMVKSGEGFDGD
jgi:hypothetical protein